MYKKSQKKRNKIRRIQFFEIQVLPYIFTGLILFILFIGVVALNVEFSNEYTMIAWILGGGYVLGSIILDFIQGNIEVMLKKADRLVDLGGEKTKKLFFILMVTIYLSTQPIRAYMKQGIGILTKKIAFTLLKNRRMKKMFFIVMVTIYLYKRPILPKWHWFTIRRSVSFFYGVPQHSFLIISNWKSYQVPYTKITIYLFAI